MSKSLKSTVIALGILGYSILGFSQKNLSIKDIWYNYIFAPKTFDDAVFLSDNESIAKLDGNKIFRLKAITGDTIGKLFDANLFKELKDKSITEFKISPNDSCILLSVDSKQLFRYSKASSWYIYFLQNKKILPLTKENSDIEIPSFGPMFNFVAFTKKNNLYVSIFGQEIQITNDGKKDSVINGRGDWVYEEEFEVTKAYEWSPIGNNIAYIKFNESAVPLYTLTSYDSIYPTTFTYKYPKAGFAPSKVSVHIYNLKKRTTLTLDIPDKFDYIPLIKWSNDGENLAIQTYNRIQNETHIFSYNIETKKIDKIYDEKRETYIPFPMGFTWLKNNLRFALVTEKNGFNQLCTFTMDGNLERNCTNWKYDVTKIIAYDKELDYLFFEAAEPDETQRRIYRVRPDGSFLGYITPERGTNYDAIFSKDYFQCIYTNSNANQEITTYCYDELKGLKNVLQSNFEDNDAWKKNFNFQQKTFLKIPVDTVKLNAWIIKPSNFEKGKKYPVLITVYGGPGHQEVTDEYSYTYFWHQYLAQQGYIIIGVDPRGTDSRGAAFRNIAYKQLGVPETNDIIDAVKYLRNQPEIDSTRIGIEGWSFGGYEVLMCMTHSKLFKCGVAIAPVTDWQYYDNVYTERYMQTPTLNPDGYKKTSVLESAKNLHGKLFLIHGLNDDNVHVQNSFALCNILNNANITYKFQLYPNKHHSLSGRATRYNLFDNVTQFLIDNL